MYEKRIELIKKYAGKEKRPTSKEINEAYGYLDFCFNCGKEFTIWDKISFNRQHSIVGNSHRRECCEQKNKEVESRW